MSGVDGRVFAHVRRLILVQLILWLLRNLGFFCLVLFGVLLLSLRLGLWLGPAEEAAYVAR